MSKVPSRRAKKSLWRFLPPVVIEQSEDGRLITNPRLPGSVIVSSLLLNILGLALPLCILQVYDRILPNHATETLALLLLGLTAVIVLDAAIKMARAKIINWTAASFSHRASLEAFRRIMKSPPAQIEAEPVSFNMNRLAALTALGDFYGGPSRLLMIDVPAAGIYLIIMGLIGHWIVLVPITLLALFTYLALRRNRELREIISKRSDHDNRKYDFVIEVLSGIQTVKSMAMEALMLRRFERLQKQVGMFSYRSMLVANNAQNTAWLYSTLSTVGVVTVGASMAISGQLSVGVVAACTLLSGQLIQPLMRGISAWAELQNIRHKYGEAMPLFDLPKARPAGAVKDEPIRSFTLDNVSLEDQKFGRSTIECVSLECVPGKIIGLYPRDATELSTFTQLLCGYDKPTSGRVLLNGTDIHDPDNAGAQESIAFIGGSPIIFQGTILDNLTVFEQHSHANMARRMAKLIGLEQEIDLLPNGYDTPLGKGVNTDIPKSTAQWITIARALTLRPKVLILDGATQILDRHAAEAVLDALQTLKKNTVIILISDQEDVLRVADERYDLWGGQLLPGTEISEHLAHSGSGTPPSQPAAGGSSASNPVHAQLVQLTSELNPSQRDEEQERIPAAQACIDPLLMALGWFGVERHLYEALPHFDKIETIEDLRAVLVRLNYMTEPRKTSIAQIDHEQLPCLFEASGKIYVLLGIEEGEVLSAFDSSTQQFIDIEDSSLKGTAYFLTPIDVIAKKEAFNKSSWLGVVSARFKRLFVLMFGLGFATNFLALALPIYVMMVYDKAIGASAPTVLFALTSGILLLMGVDLLLRRVRGLAQAYFGARLDTLIGNHAFSQLLHMQVRMTESASIGSQITRLRQLESVRDAFAGPLANAVVDMPFTLIFIAAIIMIGGQLAWVPIGLVAVYALMSAILIPIIRRQVSDAGDAKSKLQNTIMEALTYQRAIRDISAERVWIDKFQQHSADFTYKNLKTRALSFNTQTISQILMLFTGVSTLGMGSMQVLEGTLSAGALIGVMALSWRVLNPLNQAFVNLTRLGQTLQSLDQVNKLMRMPVERVPNLLPSVYRSFKGRLDLKRLIFSYPSRSDPVLRGLNISIQPGEIVAITGASGSGKSTILKVVLGLYPLQGGAVLADGLDVRQLDSGEWRHSISYVPKHFNFFYGSVAQNMKLANPTATQLDIARAAEEAGILNPEYEEFLPEGFETRLTGQRLLILPTELKQRLLLARAFVKPAPYVLLDSPAQNLSASGVDLIIKKLRNLHRRSTVVMVTQRTELIEAADRAIYMIGGQVASDGAPKDIIKRLAKAA